MSKSARTNELSPPVPTAEEHMFRGLLGDMVAAADPTTEADPVGVYVSLLAGTGALIGRSPFVQVGNTRHPLLIWPLLFGRTGSGRKGEADSTAKTFLRSFVDYTEIAETGLSSGEGLIERIRDPKDEDDSGGTEDKRLLIVEPEFSTVMARAKREGSSLAHVMRLAWQGDALRALTRTRYGTSWSHIAIVGHITPKEFRLRKADADMAGGTFNRFLPVYVERSKLVPLPNGVDEGTVRKLANRLRLRVDYAREVTRVLLDPGATNLWVTSLYDEFAAADDDDQPWTEFARRGAPYCLRIAALHAVLDNRAEVNTADLDAAGALVRYAIASAKYVLDTAPRDPKLDRLRRSVDSANERGLTRKEISALFSRNLSKDQLAALVNELTNEGEYEVVRISTGGRPAETLRRKPRPALSSFVRTAETGNVA